MRAEKKNLVISKTGKPIDKKIQISISKIKNEILKDEYILEINFITPKVSQKLNIKYRNKHYIPNILSFPLSKTEGQIFLCPSVIKKEAKGFNLSCDNFLILLITHGCLHLKGMEHGKKMETLENEISKKYMLK